jgi:hypothetical protein
VATGGTLLIAGSVVFFVGAALGVPGVFTESDPQERLRMLTQRRRAWQLAQPLYALGPLLCAAGVGALAGGAWLAASCAALAAGALAWTWSAYLRGTRVADFALGRLPAWPYVTYVLLTITGLVLLGLGLLGGDFPAWTGWLTLAAAALFLAAYLRFGDLPPFVFYVLLMVDGVAVMLS